MSSIAIIGLGRFGAALARELSDKGVEVLALDTVTDEIREVQTQVAAADAIDARNPKELEAVGVRDVDAAVVAIGEGFEAAQECVLALKSLGVPLIIARAQTEDRRRILLAIGADRVVSPEEESAKRIAAGLVDPLLRDLVDLGDNARVVSMSVPEIFWGKDLMSIAPAREFRVLILKVVKSNEHGLKTQVHMPPGATTVLEENDELTVFGRAEDVEAFSRS